MRSSIGEREHSAPRRPDESRVASGPIDSDDLMQVRHVPCYREALAATASLEGFNDVVRPGQSTRDRRHVANGRLMVTILAGLAEFERSLILARTGEGRTRAMARGVRFGRKPKLSAYQIAEAVRRHDSG